MKVKGYKKEALKEETEEKKEEREEASCPVYAG